MFSEFYNTQNWFDYNELVKSKLGGVCNFKIFPSLSGALLEVLLSLSRQLVTKKRIICLPPQSPFVHPVLRFMAGLGFDIQMLSSEKNLALSTNDVLAVVASQDLPLLGTMYDWGAERQLVAEYKTCFVQLSHCQHYCSGLEQKINTFEAYLYGFSGGMTLGAFGRRLRIDAPVAESMNWEKGQVLVEIDKFSSRSESRDKVIEFESQNLGGCRPALQMERRLYDRAVVYWKDMDGLAFVNQLAKELNKNEGSGTELLLETTSLIRWGGLKTMDWLNSLGYSLEQIRGMVVVDASLLNEIFFKKFMEAREVILQSQNGRS